MPLTMNDHTIYIILGYINKTISALLYFVHPFIGIQEIYMLIYSLDEEYFEAKGILGKGYSNSSHISYDVYHR